MDKDFTRFVCTTLIHGFKQLENVSLVTCAGGKLQLTVSAHTIILLQNVIYRSVIASAMKLYI